MDVSAHLREVSISLFLFFPFIFGSSLVLLIAGLRHAPIRLSMVNMTLHPAPINNADAHIYKDSALS
jgi:hypothetical protein